MAKKIRLDFSKVEERSGWNTRQIPEGLHKMKIDAVQQTEAQDGTAMLVYALVPADPRFKSRRFPYYCKLQQNQLWKLRDLLVAAGVSVPKRALNIDPESPVGKMIAAEAEDESNAQYAGRSVIQGTYGLDILDEGHAASSEDDEDSEDEDEDYDEPDEDETDEEAEEDDLSEMSLPELRKLAKEYGIKTTGLSKSDLIDEITDAQFDAEADEDDEDEDDEDLPEEEEEDDYEDEEDEEEDDEPEPEPAPKRRPRAAAAAPAKRTVRRSSTR